MRTWVQIFLAGMAFLSATSFAQTETDSTSHSTCSVPPPWTGWDALLVPPTGTPLYQTRTEADQAAAHHRLEQQKEKRIDAWVEEEIIDNGKKAVMRIRLSLYPDGRQIIIYQYPGQIGVTILSSYIKGAADQNASWLMECSTNQNYRVTDITYSNRFDADAKSKTGQVGQDIDKNDPLVVRYQKNVDALVKDLKNCR